MSASAGVGVAKRPVRAGYRIGAQPVRHVYGQYDAASSVGAGDGGDRVVGQQVSAPGGVEVSAIDRVIEGPVSAVVLGFQ